MLSAESAVLVEFHSVGCVFLVLHGVVIALFALCAGKSDFDSHSNGTSEIYLASLYFAFPIAYFSEKKGTKKEPSTEVRLLYHKLSVKSSIFFEKLNQPSKIY